MITAGFIEKKPGGTIVHDWDDYIGKLLKAREETREKERLRKQKYRERKKSQQEQKPESIDNSSGTIDREWLKIVQSYETNIGILPIGTAGDMLVGYYEDLGADVVCKAIEVTNKAQPDVPWKYLKSVLQKWLENDINTPEKADAYTKDLERRLAEAKKRKRPAETAEPPAISGEFY